MPAKEEVQKSNCSQRERQNALREAMQRHGDHVFAFIYSMVGRDEELVRDLAQDTWLKVYQSFKLEKFGEIGLLLHKAQQVVIDHRRRQRMRHLVEFRDDMSKAPIPFEPREQEGLPNEEFVWNEFWGLFEGAGFDPVDMKCVWMIHRYGYTVQETAGGCGKLES